MPDQPEWIPVSSANLDSVLYDPDSQTLRIRFNNGREYSYGLVPASVAQELIRSDSPGKFFHNSIRGAFPDEETG